jgi:signal transduction histidine kinase/ActR/RegA family two-component response regulator/transcriptional regulator with GAF, ATPase, and Fis domain
MTPERPLDAADREILLDLALLTNERPSLQEVFAAFATRLLGGARFDYAALIAFEPDRRFARVVGSYPDWTRPTPDREVFLERQAGIERLRAFPEGSEFDPGGTELPGVRLLAEGGLRRVWAIPLLHQGESYGAFTVGRISPDPFDDRGLAFLRIAAGILAAAVYEETSLALATRAAARGAVLNDLAILLNAGESVEVIFDRLIELMGQALAFDCIGLSVMDRPGWLRVVDARPPIRAGKGELHAAGESQLDDILSSGGTLAQWRTDRVEGLWPNAYREAGLARMITAVLKHGAEILGILVLGRRTNLAFSPDDTEFMELVATLLSQAVASERRVGRVEAEAERSRILNELAFLLNAGRTVDDLFEGLPELLGRIMSFDYTALMVATGHDRELRVVAARPFAVNPVGATITFDGANIPRILATGSTMTEYRTDRVDGDAPRALAEGGIRRVLAVVLQQGVETLGLFVLGRRANLPFTDEDRAFVALVTTLLRQAVSNQLRLDRVEAGAARSELLNQLALLLNAGEPVEALFDRLQALILQAVAADYVSLMAESPSGDQWRLVGSQPWIAFQATDSVSPQEAGREGLLSSAERVVQYRPEHVDLPVTRLLAEAGIARVAAALLSGPGGPIGSLNIGRRKNVHFTAEDVAFIEVVSTLLAQSVANQRHIEATRREAEEQRIIAEVAAAAARETDPRALTEALVESVRRFVPRPFLGFAFRDGDKAVFHGREGRHVVPLMELDRRALDEGQVSVPELAPYIPAGHPVEPYGIHAATHTRSESGGSAIGLLVIASRQEGFVFRERELRLARLMAAIVGPALAAATAAPRVAAERAVYDLILRSVSEAVILLDKDFRTVFANAEGLRLIEAVDPDRTARTPEDHLPTLPADTRAAFLTATQEGNRSRGRTTFHREGRSVTYEFELVPLDHPEFRLLAVASDVTAEVEREAEREHHREEIEKASRLAALGELIGGVAHELNNPLTAILGFSELMATSPGAEPFTEEVGVIRKEATRASEIVRDLLFIARPGPVERREVPITEIAGHLERLRRSVWASEGITVTFDLDRLTSAAWGNEHQLTQVLLNLTTNAEQAVHGVAAPRIEFTARSEGDNVVITVADNGHGMDAGTRARIFEPFFTTKQGRGTGLGLSLSYTIVAAHEGHIDVDSRPGGGTRFTITLPAARLGSSPSKEAPPASPARRRILVIDDEPSLRKVCQRLIASMGHDCAVAESAAEALRLTAAANFDLILCDYRLATETADLFVDGLASATPALIERVVIATGATTDTGVIELTERYQLKLIAKPYGVDDIARVIAEVTSGSVSPA